MKKYRLPLYLATLLIAISTSISSTACESSPKSPITLFIIGDSTASNYKSPNRMFGWGQVLPDRASPGLKIVNAAIPGRSAKSYYTQGDWQKIIHRIKTGDHVFIQFGHNDSSSDPARSTQPFTTYAEFLRMYVADIRSRGGVPTILTPISQRNFQQRMLMPSHIEYRQSAIDIAKRESILLLDLAKQTESLFSQLGESGTRTLFMVSVDGHDNTHLTRNGANTVVSLLITELCNTNHPLAGYLNADSAYPQ